MQCVPLKYSASLTVQMSSEANIALGVEDKVSARKRKLKDKDKGRCRGRDEIESEEGGEYDNFEMIDESDMIYLA